MVRGGNSKGYGLLGLFLVAGAVIGGVLGEFIATTPAFSGIAPFLVKTFPVFDVPPMTINLYVIKLVLGFAFYPNLISILGMIIAIVLFRRF